MASLRALFQVLTILFVSLTLCDGNREILVGGKLDSWKIPESANDTLNMWAEKTRFKVGDVLVWRYDGKTDSVLQVAKEDYESCNASKTIKEYKDGNTKIELDRSGHFYFISGADGHCGKGEKLHLVVLSPNHKPSSGTGTVDAPAPAPHKNGGANGLDGRGFFGASLFVLLGLVPVVA